MNPAALLRENEERRAKQNEPYDPVRGIGGPLEREPVRLSESLGEVYVPLSMLELEAVAAAREAGSVEAYARSENIAVDRAINDFHATRWQHDFEFWCATRVVIDNKKGEEVPFVLWKPQRLLVEKLEAQRLAGKPVRQIVLKHRQWGCTTTAYTYIAWHQMVLYENRDSWFVGLDVDNARDVIARFDKIRKALGFGWKPYAGMQNTRIIEEREATVSAGTVQRPNAPSGRTPQYIQLTEVGKWPSNSTVSAERVVQNVESMLVDEPGTVGIIESTAQGQTGTYYKELCDRALAGQVSYDFLFVGAYMDPQYQLEPAEDLPLKSYEKEDVEAFVKKWDSDHREYWSLGATLEHLNWYIWKQNAPGYITNPTLIKEEFPQTPREAFQTGQQRVIPVRYVTPQRDNCREPEIGRLVASGLTGADAFAGIEFEPDVAGELKVWQKPGHTYGGLFPEDAQYKFRYVASSDVGPGQSKTASWSVTSIYDRLPTMYGAPMELAARWRGHLDVDLYAWRAAQLAMWYEAHWIIEVNSLESEKEMDERSPNYGQTVLDEVKGTFPVGRIYQRRQFDADLKEFVDKLGWWTSRGTKEVMISSLVKHLRGYENYQNGEDVENAVIERDMQALQEMDTYIRKGQKMRAAPGKHDDILDTVALACFYNTDLAPVKKVDKKKTRRANVVSAAQV